MTFPETLVARVTGIAKKLVAEKRKTAALEKGADWDVDNSCVVYTAAGLKKICQALGLDSAALHWPAASASDLQPSDAAESKTEGSAAKEQAAIPHAAAEASTLRARLEQFSPSQLVTALAILSDQSTAAEATDPAPALANQVTAATVAAGVEQLQADAPELVSIAVMRTAPNPRIVYGRIVGSEPARAVIVGVRDNRNFVPGMKLQAHHAGGDYYRMFGNCPRWPGRW